MVGRGDFLTEEEEKAVITEMEEELMQKRGQTNGTDFRTSPYNWDLPTSPPEVRTPPSIPATSYRPMGRTYGIGPSGAMREADIMRKAKRNVSGKSTTSFSAEDAPPLPRSFSSTSSLASKASNQSPEVIYRDTTSSTWSPPPVGRLANLSPGNKRKSMLETLPPSAQSRISRALLQIESDMLQMVPEPAEEMLRENVLPVDQADSNSMETPVKKRIGNRRQPSITRSPAFHDNLADVASKPQIAEGSTLSSALAPSGLSGNRQSDIQATGSPDDGRYDDADVFGSPILATTSYIPAPGTLVSPSRMSDRNHRPAPLQLAPPIATDTALQTSTTFPVIMTASREGMSTAFLNVPEGRESGAATAVSKSSFRTENTGSYAAETPSEGTGPTNLGVEPSGNPLPSPQDYTFDISGYYGDGDESDEEQQPIADTAAPNLHGHPSHVLNSPVGSDYSAENQEGRMSPIESLFNLSLKDQNLSKVDWPEGTEPEEELGVSFQDLKLMQEKLNEAAKLVRQTMTEGQVPRTQREQPSVGDGSNLRARPSIRLRGDQPEPRMKRDAGVVELARALSPKPASPESVQVQKQTIPQNLFLKPLEEVSEAKHEPPETKRMVTPPALSVNRRESHQPRTPITSPIAPGSESPSHQTGTSQPQSERDAAKTRLAQALFGPTEALASPPSPVRVTQANHRRMESASSARSFRIDEDPDVRRDFEARIAQATAALQKVPSVKLSRKNTKNKAIKIGSPTLLQTSATIQVSPLTSPQVAQKGFASPGQPIGGFRPRTHQRVHGKSASISSLANVEPPITPPETASTSGFKGLLAKIKRKPSQKQATKPSKLPIIAPLPAASIRPFPGTQTYGGVTAAPPTATVVRQQSIGKPNPVDLSRRSVLRRTIIVPTNAGGLQIENSPLLGTVTEADDSRHPSEGSNVSRRPSVRRKPVQRTSRDHALEAEFLAPPVQHDQARLSPQSVRDSLFDLYKSPGNISQPSRMHSTQSIQALEIREMSDGEVIWGVVGGLDDNNEEDLASFHETSQGLEQSDDNAHEMSSTSSYRKPSMSSDVTGNFDLDEDEAWSAAERDILETPVDRPQTKVS
jgi:hypothetical protein